MTGLPPTSPDSSLSTPGRQHWRLGVPAYLLLLSLSLLARRAAPDEEIPPGTRIVRVREEAGSGEDGAVVWMRIHEFPSRPWPGDHLPLLLVPGEAGEYRGLLEVAELIAQSRPVVVLVPPEETGPAGQMQTADLRARAGAILPLLDSLGMHRVHLGGSGLGGVAVLETQALAPERTASLSLLSADGVQEFELLGDYHLNRGLYAVENAGLWLLREAVPHFGALDRALPDRLRVKILLASDLRPVRGILERYPGPMLIIHGRHDTRLPEALAREHARLVPQAEIVLGEGGHRDPLSTAAAEAAAVEQFLARVEAGVAGLRATAAPERLAAAVQPFDPRQLPSLGGFPLLLVCLLLALATLISEDLTCITAGLMVARGSLAFPVATAACFIGIFGGDLLVFLAGRSLGRAVLRRAPVRWFLSAGAVAWSSQWLERQGAALVFATRVLPGTRLPTYFAAGMLRTSFSRFALYFFAACLIWTPLLVGFAAVSGEAAHRALGIFRDHAALYLLITALALFLLLKLAIPLSTFRGRRLLLSRWRRITHRAFRPRWELGPMLLYCLVRLSLRYGGLRLVTAVNPGLAGGGFGRGSRAARFSRLTGAEARAARFDLIPVALPPVERSRRALEFRDRNRLDWPLILSPDAGRGGTGVARVTSEAEVRAYLAQAGEDILVQEEVPGAEFSVWYLRAPDQAKGRIAAIAGKEFPEVTGDGRQTLEELILRDDLAVSRAPLYFRRHAGRLAWIPPRGDRIPLVEVGTRDRGVIFRDATDLRTAELEAALDLLVGHGSRIHAICLDLRVPDTDSLREGKHLTVTGVSGPGRWPTNIYDPRLGFPAAFRILKGWWGELFAIAAANRAAGAGQASWRELVALAVRRRPGKM